MFYVNKFPMLEAIKVEGMKEFQSLPVGTIFTVHGIGYGDGIKLKPIKHKIEDCMNTHVSVAMLGFAFTATESVSLPNTSSKTD